MSDDVSLLVQDIAMFHHAFDPEATVTVHHHDEEMQNLLPMAPSDETIFHVTKKPILAKKFRYYLDKDMVEATAMPPLDVEK